MELRDRIARTIAAVPVERGGYSVVQTVVDEHFAQADAILALPEIKEALELHQQWESGGIYARRNA